jgi:hypothetical protein
MKVDLTNRWTVLDYNSDPNSARGKIPESWCCVDCGVNTAPGMPNRREMDIAIAIYGKAECTFTDDQELYMVTDEVWRMIGLEGMGGCLCIGCLEKRIGRRLKPSDFPDHEFNLPCIPATRRLLKRRGR